MQFQDYIDAFEKILHLAIKDHRVTVSVIIHCCLSEKIFNPYYAVVAQKFCDYDRKYQVSGVFLLIISLGIFFNPFFFIAWLKQLFKVFLKFLQLVIIHHKFSFFFYQLAFQYAIWDRIKDIQSHTKTQLTNLAQLLVHLITNAAQAISVLKVIEFGELDKVTLRVVRQVLLGILLGKEEVCKEVIIKTRLSIVFLLFFCFCF